MKTATTILLTVAAASNATNSSLAIQAPQTNSSLAIQTPQTNYIQRCSYFHVMSGHHTWPGGDDVCNRGTQNSCINDPNLSVGTCNYGSNFLGSYTSTQIVTNITHFWTVVYNSYPTRSKTNHCQAGTEMKPQDIPSKMLPLKHGQFNECMPQYPGVGGTLNPDWSEPSNFCSNHNGKNYKIVSVQKENPSLTPISLTPSWKCSFLFMILLSVILHYPFFHYVSCSLSLTWFLVIWFPRPLSHRSFSQSDAEKCVGYAYFTSTGSMNCKKANRHETSIEMICGGDVFGNPPCGCFGGTKYFFSRL